jgi:hypothetical protein
MTIHADYALKLLDVEKLCRNWKQNSDGTQVEMGTRAAALEMLAKALNRLLGRMPRTVFQMAQPITSPTAYLADQVGSDPLYVWKYRDGVVNARQQEVRIITTERASGSGNSYARRENNSAGERTDIIDYTRALNLCENLFTAYYPVRVGGPCMAETTDGISTFNKYPLFDVVVQDAEIYDLDTDVHRYVDPGLAKTGEPVLARLLEEIRRLFHELRTENLPIFGMGCSQCQAGTWATPSSTDETATVIDGAVVGTDTYVNISDQTVTSRTATSPGIFCYAYRAGIGTYDEFPGTTTKLMCRVFGQAPSHNMTVKFIGPDHVTANWTEITVTAGGGAAWHGTASNFIYLNTAAADNDTTTERNKVDIHAKMAGASNGYIYAHPMSMTT